MKAGVIWSTMLISGLFQKEWKIKTVITADDGHLRHLSKIWILDRNLLWFSAPFLFFFVALRGRGGCRPGCRRSGIRPRLSHGPPPSDRAPPARGPLRWSTARRTRRRRGDARGARRAPPRTLRPPRRRPSAPPAARRGARRLVRSPRKGPSMPARRPLISGFTFLFSLSATESTRSLRAHSSVRAATPPAPEKATPSPAAESGVGGSALRKLKTPVRHAAGRGLSVGLVIKGSLVVMAAETLSRLKYIYIFCSQPLTK